MTKVPRTTPLRLREMSIDDDSLQQRYKDVIDALTRYLTDAVHIADPRMREDFERDGVVLRAKIPSEQEVRLFVSHEFLSDFSATRAANAMREWRIGDKVRTLPRGMTLFLTTEGTFTERTSV